MTTPIITDKAAPDYQCSSVQDSCTYETEGTTFSLPCKCGLTPDGHTFCPTIYTEGYTELLAEVARRIGQASCHTLDRFDVYKCLMLHVKTDDDVALLDKFIIAKYEREQNQNIRKNSDCIKSHSKVSQYWDAIVSKTMNEEFH